MAGRKQRYARRRQNLQVSQQQGSPHRFVLVHLAEARHGCQPAPAPPLTFKMEGDVTAVPVRKLEEKKTVFLV